MVQSLPQSTVWCDRALWAERGFDSGMQAGGSPIAVRECLLICRLAGHMVRQPDKGSNVAMNGELAHCFGAVGGLETSWRRLIPMASR